MPDGGKKHLREIIDLKAEAIALALELQARSYEAQLKALAVDLAAARAQIARILWVAAGVSLAASVVVTITGLLIAGVGLWLAFRK